MMASFIHHHKKLTMNVWVIDDFFNVKCLVRFLRYCWHLDGSDWKSRFLKTMLPLFSQCDFVSINLQMQKDYLCTINLKTQVERRNPNYLKHLSLRRSFRVELESVSTLQLTLWVEFSAFLLHFEFIASNFFCYFCKDLKELWLDDPIKVSKL